jgi:hypothetical protein
VGVIVGVGVGVIVGVGVGVGEFGGVVVPEGVGVGVGVFCMYPLDVTIADVEIEPWITVGSRSITIMANAVTVVKGSLIFDVFYFPSNTYCILSLNKH